MERAQENFRPLDFPLEMVHPKGHVRQLAYGSGYRAVGLESQILDPLRMPQRIGHPDFRVSDVHLLQLLLCGRDTHVIEGSHTLYCILGVGGSILVAQ